MQGCKICEDPGAILQKRRLNAHAALSQSYVILPECIHRVEHMIILDDSFSCKKRSNGTTRKMWVQKGPGMTSDPPTQR